MVHRYVSSAEAIIPHNDPTAFTLWSYQTCQGNVASMGLKPDNFVAVIKLAQSMLAFTPIVQSDICAFNPTPRYLLT